MSMMAVAEQTEAESVAERKPTGKALWLLAPGVLWMVLFLVVLCFGLLNFIASQWRAWFPR